MISHFVVADALSRNIFIFGRPFHYATVSKAYEVLYCEWRNVQKDLGQMASLSVGANGLGIFTSFVFLLFFRQLRYFSKELTPINTWLYVSFMILYAFPPIALTLHSMIAANSSAAHIEDELTVLFGAHELSSAGSGEEAIELSAIGRIGKYDESDIAMGVAVMRFAAFVARNPCELRILGRKISWRDVYKAVSVAVFAQLINLLGLG